MVGKGPVVVGGIGGSGTRVVAEMLTSMGFFIGQDLNSASDNLTYTLLFKRPAWFKKNFNSPKQIFTGLSVLEKSMVTGKYLTFREKLFVRRAVAEMSRFGHNKEGEGRGEWPYIRKTFIKKPDIPRTDSYTGWGWKEPNSHLLIRMYNEYFPDFKYIHTIRHGLDMAFSSNQQQLYNWASLFEIDLPVSQDDIPRASLRYWVEANRSVIAIAEQLGSEKILIVNFDELCRDPVSGTRKIMDFINVSFSQTQLDEIAKLPVTPGSSGRYKLFPKVIFDPEDVSFAEQRGFCCDY